MSQRITITNLRALTATLNRITGSPDSYMIDTPDGKRTINVGHYHISQAYGGYCLHRTINDAGGVTCPIVHGHVSARELFDRMHAYMDGLRDAASVLKRPE